MSIVFDPAKNAFFFLCSSSSHLFLSCTAVNGQPSGTYEQTMAVIAGSPRPVTITFLDRVNGIGSGGAGNHYAGVGGGPPTAPRQSWVGSSETRPMSAA